MGRCSRLCWRCKINDVDFVVTGVRNSDGDTWLSLKPKPQPQPTPQPTDQPKLSWQFRGRLSPYRNNMILAAALMLEGLDRSK